MIKNNKLILIVIAVVAAIVVYFSFSSSKKSIDVRQGQIRMIETMVQLCAVDLYNEVPVRDTINNKVIFGIQKQKGSVSFDLENMVMDTDGDTVKITLSPEIVELYEATEDNSWEAIDEKGLGWFTKGKLSNDEENAVKSRIKQKSRKMLYHNGIIERARAEGAVNLQTLMEKVYRKPVKVIDPTPKGAYYDEFK